MNSTIEYSLRGTTKRRCFPARGSQISSPQGYHDNVDFRARQRLSSRVIVPVRSIVANLKTAGYPWPPAGSITARNYYFPDVAARPPWPDLRISDLAMSPVSPRWLDLNLIGKAIPSAAPKGSHKMARSPFLCPTPPPPILSSSRTPKQLNNATRS